LFGDAEPTIGLGKQRHAAVRRDPPAIEGSADLFALYRWQVEG
jgi:hypothetical protein